jgi:GT2 family glycosyltransferase
LYNNSPEIKITESEEYQVVNSTKNDMLAGAYNYALEEACKNNCDWLLLLDQDTNLTKEYFEEINEVLASKPKASAIIPILKKGEIHLSPHSYFPKLGYWWILHEIKDAGIIENRTIAAFNSASVLSVSDLQLINGFSKEYPLDMLDTNVFYNLCCLDKQFYLLNTELQHDLSMLDYENKMTRNRYISIITSEDSFSKQLGTLAVITFRIKLIFRCVKQLFAKDKRKYFLITLKFLYKIR